ncbi:uncharacterized protein BDW47DRAFT_27078 [Aspergillus candidus]|uniref:Uncharacterized protein n=1 Tax=Aspergillus candidus TaxID=41067 RepID=A0A2I2FNY1_ASPCN|nr:hypothetical protein BDW47DRAFT_27078 [Aspergillus candidus]PLB42335.1 hypothetical protein BDW47DRAFT_27078 [Aspergillus candidus]
MVSVSSESGETLAFRNEKRISCRRQQNTQLISILFAPQDVALVDPVPNQLVASFDFSSCVGILSFYLGVGLGDRTGSCLMISCIYIYFLLYALNTLAS